MPDIKLDSDRVQHLNLSNVSIDELENLMINTADEVSDEVEQEDATLNIAAIGGNYTVGPIDIRLALGNVMLLSEINSPFITGELGDEGDELNAIDCCKALYVLAKGKEAVKPIMAIKQQVQSMLLLKPMVEKNPELFDKLMDRVEKISEAEKVFEETALQFYRDNFVGPEFQDVLNQVFLAIADMVKTANDLPTDGEKKKVIN